MAVRTTSPEHGASLDSESPDSRARGPEALRSVIQHLTGVDCPPHEVAPALIKLARAKQEMGHQDEAEDLFRKAVEICEQILGPDHPALVPALNGLGEMRVLRGSTAEAEPHFTRAMKIREIQLGPDHPDLIILVNDFARLYLKHSAYACAEPLLQRLLTMKRSKGEDHPEVATVLASLATTRQALGHHESAEQLWRRVLEIRERTLAPNHFAIVTALEHLADACTARGKIQSALELLKRALRIRELTLGADHASLRVSRERIADLELQASEDSLEPRTATVFSSSAEVLAPIPDTWRLVTTERPNAVAVPPPHIRSAVVRGWNAVPIVERDELTESPIEHTGIASGIAGGNDRKDLDDAQYRDFVQSVRAEMESDEPQTLPSTVAAIIASAVDLLRRQRREVMSVAAVLVVLVIALASGSWASSEVEPPVAEIPLNGSVAVGGLSLPEAAPGGPLTVAVKPVDVPAAAGAASLSQSVPRRDVRATGRTVATARNARSPISPTALTRLDSALQGVNASIQPVIQPLSIEVGLTAAAPTFTKLTGIDSDVSPATRQPARLIGALPVPRLPNQFYDVEGEVRVTFHVDVTGRPVMSTFAVEHSTDSQFTDAVRRVIPQLRFEPARAGGHGSKPLVDSVHITYRFAKK